MSHKYHIIKPAQAATGTIDCTGCKYIRRLLTSLPCRLCAGARLDSERDYHTGRVGR